MNVLAMMRSVVLSAASLHGPGGLLLAHNRLEWVLKKMDIGAPGYFVLFSLLFSCGIGMPIPEDIPLIVAGLLIASHHMLLLPAAICAWCGIIGGDIVLYTLGHHFGHKITKLPLIGHHFTEVRLDKAELLFQRWGVLVVGIGRLFAGVRGVMVVAAGTIRFNILKFVIADGLAALVSGGLFMFLGHWAGQKDRLQLADDLIKRAGYWLFLIAAPLLVLFIWFKVWEHRHAKPSEIIMEKVVEKTIPPQTTSHSSSEASSQPEALSR